MKDFYRTAVKIIVAFLVALVVINDGVSIAITHWRAAQAAERIAAETATSYKQGGSGGEAYAASQRIAEEEEVTLDVWQVNQGKLTVTVTKKVRRTFFIHHVARYLDFLKPYLTATSTMVVNVPS